MENSLAMKIQKNSLSFKKTAQNLLRVQKENYYIQGLDYSSDNLGYRKLGQFSCTE